jgi:mono/diheme cytochrome c family protein
MMYKYSLCTALALIGALALSAERPAPQPADAGDPLRGKDLYFKVGCYECHASEAQGSPVTAPKLGPDALPFVAFNLFVRQPRVQMPAYGPKVLTDADIKDIYAYVSSRARPTVPSKVPE